MINKYSIKSSQISFLFLALLPIGKLVLMPSTVSFYSNEDGWITVLLIFILDILLLWFLLKMTKKFDKPLFEVLEENVGGFCAKAVFFLYAVYFLLKGFMPFFEQKDYIESMLYDTSPSILTFLPFFIASALACVKDLRVLTRCSVLCALSTVLGLGLVLFLSVSEADFTALLPIGGNPFYDTALSAYKILFWFSDSIYMLFFMGNFKYDKKGALRIFFFYAAAAAIVCFFVVVFYGMFESVAVRQLYALSKMSKYNVALSNVGRFDYIAIFLLIFSSVFSCILPLFFAAFCLKCAFGLQYKLIPAIIVNTLVGAAIIVLNSKFSNVFVAYQNYLTPFFIVMAYVLPLSLIFMRRKNEQV